MSTGTEPVDDSPELPATTAPRVHGRKRRALGILIRLCGFVFIVMAGLLIGGFLRFADMVSSLRPPDNPKVDAIVVLTGGYQRIDQAVDLLKSGIGKRLLISGVHPSTSRTQIQRLTQSSEDLFKCCVDMGYEAMDTIGNANETNSWIADKGYSRILVVTNNYHMPRSLFELRRVNPHIEFVAWPVVNSDLNGRNWLSDPDILRTLLSEYAKLTVAMLRSPFIDARPVSTQAK